MELSEHQIKEIIDRLRQINTNEYSCDLTSDYSIESLFKELELVEKNDQKNKKSLDEVIEGLTERFSGDYFTSFEISETGDEFDVIKSAFNTYIEEIQEVIVSKNELEKINKELKQVISENEKLSKAKDEFISNMSHEFRTPLNGILNFSYILKDRLDNKNDSITEINYIIYSSNILLSFIDNILNSNDLINYNLNVSEFNPSLLVKIIADTLSTLAHARSISINIINELDESFKIKSDQKLLINICSNLLSNSIKFSEMNKPVEVILQNDSENLIVYFIDNGPGIDNEKIELLTQPFTQDNKDYNKTFGGIGLGLSVVKQSLNLTNSTIEIESKKDIGSKIKITIPQISDDSKEILPDRKLKILVVEDNIINQVLMKTILQNENHTVVLANDGVDGYEKFILEDFDIILMDLMMPLMNGYETTQKIRFMSDPIKSNIPIIAVTADVSPKIKEKCSAFGMNDYIAKPYTKEELFDIIKKYS
jgi:signal transduction histidine kinase